MKKSKIILATTLSLVAILALAIPGIAAPAGHWLTDYTLMNLSSTNSAFITVRRYSQCASGCSADAGTVVYTKNIPAGGSEYYNPGLDSTFPASFAGSIAIESSQPLAGIVTMANNLTGSAYASDAYGAITTPDTTTYLPLVQRSGTASTRITVQNTGSTNTNITISYIGTGHPANTIINNLPANMMAMVDMSDLGSMTFTGSAMVVSTPNPVAVVAEQYKTTGGVLASYNGVPSSGTSTTLYLPGYIDQRTWETTIGIASAGASGTVTVTFTGSTATLSGPVSATSSVRLNRYAAFPSGWSGTFPTIGYYGAAVINSTTAVAVAYNIDNGGAGGPGNWPIAYVAAPTSNGATTVVEPLIENSYSSGWLTTFSVLSIDGTPAHLSMTFTGNLPAKCNPCVVDMSSAAQTFDQSKDGFLPTGFIGGVKIVANKNIIVIADQANPHLTSGDSAAGFVGYPNP